MEHLEEFKSQIVEHKPVCPPFEAVNKTEKPGISQLPLGEGKPKLEDVKPQLIMGFCFNDCQLTLVLKAKHWTGLRRI